ncbi:MAG: LEA type 2 family protein [Sphingobacteriales bacterium]|nr:LEA type 2 family protein [Sphingobacteriales bacterium]MBI3718809.1 LEA type 2 family protein [Sphingobacteriales bacterium]
MKKIIFTLGSAVLLLSACNTTSKVQEPEFRDVKDVRLVNVGVLNTTAGVDLIYYNPNNFGVELADARGDVYVDGQYLGRFNLNDKVSIGKRKEFVIPALVSVDNLGLVKNQRDIYKKKEVTIRIDGFARLKKAGFSKEIPVKYEGVQSVDKFRSIVSH